VPETTRTRDRNN